MTDTTARDAANVTAYLEASMVPDPDLSIAQGAIAAWPGAWQGKNYRDITATLGYDIDSPWRELPAAELLRTLVEELRG